MFMRAIGSPSAMNPLTRKLENFVRFSLEDKAAIDRLVSTNLRVYGRRKDIVCEGARAGLVRIILSGWVCRYRNLEDGRRAIVGFCLPGDLCDLNIFMLREMDHSLATITPVTLAQITAEDFKAVTLSHPRVLQAFWWDTLVREAIQREWTANVGRRTALTRIAHLLCEMFYRLRSVGLTRRNKCDLPITQNEMADSTGLSNIHVNRSLQELRSRGFIVLEKKILTIKNLKGLEDIALFKPNYLHLGREGAHLDYNNE
jgi:CRP-like cAMP-binding protein